MEAVKCGGQMTSDPWDYEWRKAPMKKGKFIKALKCFQKLNKVFLDYFI